MTGLFRIYRVFCSAKLCLVNEIINILKMVLIFSYLFYSYLLIGLLIGLWFVFKGVGKIDAATKSASWGLRLLWLPGSIAMWPLLLRKIIG